MYLLAIEPIRQVLLEAAGMTMGIFVGLTVFTFKVCKMAIYAALGRRLERILISLVIR